MVAYRLRITSATTVFVFCKHFIFYHTIVEKSRANEYAKDQFTIRVGIINAVHNYAYKEYAQKIFLSCVTCIVVLVHLVMM